VSSSTEITFSVQIQVFCCELEHAIVCRRQGLKKKSTKLAHLQSRAKLPRESQEEERESGEFSNAQFPLLSYF